MTATNTHTYRVSRIACAANADAGAQRVVMAILAMPKSLWRSLQMMEGRARSRRQLAELNDRLLRDIGLTPEQRDAEVRKPFWRDQE